MISNKRLEIIKKKGFPPEKCHMCAFSRGSFIFTKGCEVCSYKGYYHQQVKEEWLPPVLAEGEKAEAYLDNTSWVLSIVKGEDRRDYTDWPFIYRFATHHHLETLGFEVQDG